MPLIMIYCFPYPIKDKSTVIFLDQFTIVMKKNRKEIFYWLKINSNLIIITIK
jgi:hypothetical protein